MLLYTVLLARNLLLDKGRVCVIDFGNSSRRCSACNICNEYTSYESVNDISCDDCWEWNNGRLEDIRDVAYLVYHLAKLPTLVSENRENTCASEEMQVCLKYSHAWLYIHIFVSG